MVIDWPGLRNAFYAWVLQAFQESEEKIPLPKTLLTWSGGVPIAVGYLLWLSMKEICEWSQSEFPTWLINPEKTKKMYGSFCDWIYREFTAKQVAEKLAPLKILASKWLEWDFQPHIFENLSGDREELMEAMITSAWLPKITHEFEKGLTDGQFSLSFWGVSPAELIVDGRDGLRRVTLAVSERVGATIFLNEKPDKEQKKRSRIFEKLFWDKSDLNFSSESSKKLYESGYETGKVYLKKMWMNEPNT
jgi:hypothetical protein